MPPEPNQDYNTTVDPVVVAQNLASPHDSRQEVVRKTKRYGIIIAGVLVLGAILIVGLNELKTNTTHKVSSANKASPSTATLTSAKPVTDIWTGKGQTENWSDTGNWSAGVPLDGYSVVFNAINGVIGSNNDIKNLSLKTLTFQGGGSTGVDEINLTGQPLTLGGGLTDNAGSAVSVDFSFSIFLSASQTFTINGVFGVDPNSSPELVGTVVDIGRYELSLAGNSNSISINALSGTGTVALNLASGGSFIINQASPDFSGNVVLSSGLATIGNVSSFGSGSIEVDNGAELVIVSNGQSSSTLSNNLSLNGNGISGAGAVNISGSNNNFIFLGKISLNGNAQIGFSDNLGNPQNGGSITLVSPAVTNGYTLTGTSQGINIQIQ